MRLVVPIFLALAAIAGCSKPTGVAGDIDFPRSFDRATYISAKLDGLEKHCELLEHIYRAPSTDTFVVAEIERLVAQQTLLIYAVQPDVGILFGKDVSALLAVIEISENENFGVALGLPLVLGPSIEYLRTIKPELEAQRDLIRSRWRVD